MEKIKKYYKIRIIGIENIKLELQYCKRIIVKVDSYEDAMRIVEGMYDNEEIILNKSSRVVHKHYDILCISKVNWNIESYGEDGGGKSRMFCYFVPTRWFPSFSADMTVFCGFVVRK